MLGGLSVMIESQYPGIAIQAVAMTLGTLACMLLAYRAGVIRATTLQAGRDRRHRGNLLGVHGQLAVVPVWISRFCIP